ncbi:MAG: nucleotidyltransferase domain-containing protein [Nanoarchaeota archaeon]
MEIEIKKTVKAGNSSAVILPRAWLDQEVRVELIKKTPQKILYETLSIVGRYIDTKEIIGIYLVGSYARQEDSGESDIDILIVTSNVDKEMIHDGIYSILIISDELLRWKLENDLLPIGPMIKEAISLINSSYLNSIKITPTVNNLKWYIETTKDKLGLIRNVLDITKEKVNDKVVYSLVLRIRTLYTILKLINNEKYSKKEFVRLIEKISGTTKVYDSYVLVKNNLEKDAVCTKEEAEKLYTYLANQLKKVIILLKKNLKHR